MATPVLTLDHLGKAFPLGFRPRDNTGSLRTAWHALKSLLRPVPVEQPAPFWAVSDVSFSVARGEPVGLIGRNGAGKSTLLRMLSGFTEPTSGRARIRGRVAAALDAKTDFHPDLTGREKIFWRGAALGMTRPQVRARFDELVAFTELEKFLDTPMKRYSLGMATRMAFAIPAHLDSQLLLVDEVLSSADGAFREKGLAKMRQVAGEGGRAVLFVSHDMVAVRQVCPRALLMHQGTVVADGPVDGVVDGYLASWGIPADAGAARGKGGSDVQAQGGGQVPASGGPRRAGPAVEKVDATDVPGRVAELLDRAALGEAFEITQDGRPLARLIPAGPGHDRAAADP